MPPTTHETHHPVRRLLPSTRQGAVVAFSILLAVAIIGPGVVMLPGIDADHDGTAAASSHVWNSTGNSSTPGKGSIWEAHEQGQNGKWYVVWSNEDDVHRYDSNWNHEANMSTTSECNNPVDIQQQDDGKWALLCSYSGQDQVFIYTDTWSYTGTSHMLNDSISWSSLEQKEDGSWLVLEKTNNRVVEWSSDFQTRGNDYSLSLSDPHSLRKSHTGLFYIADKSSATVYEYSDDTFPSYDNSYSLSEQSSAESIAQTDGGNWWAGSADTDTVYEYTGEPPTDPVSGQVTDRDGDPVSNATVYAAGYEAADPPVIDGTPFDEHVKDPLPDGWDSQLDEPGIDRGKIDPSEPEWSEIRVLLHTSDDWELQGPNMGRSIWEYVLMDENEPRSEVVNPEVNLDKPRTTIAPEDSGVLTCWEFNDGDLLDRPDPIDEEIPGAQTTSCAITIERVDPIGGSVGQSRTRETNPFVEYDSRFYELGVSDKTHEAVGWDPGQGVYKVYPEDKQENAMYYAVAPNGDVRTLESDIENWASDRAEVISKWNEEARAEYDAGNLEIVSGTTNETGHYTLDVPNQATEAELRVVKAGGVNSAPEGDLTRTDLREDFDTTVRSNFRDATSVSFEEADEETLVSVCRRMDSIASDVGIPFYGQDSTDIPNQNADIQGEYLIPEDLDQRVRRCAALSYLESIRDGYGDFLSPGLADDLADLSTEELRELLRKVQGVIETNDVLCDTYADELGVESCEDAIENPDDLSRGELEDRVSDGYDTIDDSSDNLRGGGGGIIGGGGGVDVGNGDTDVDDENNEFTASFPVDGVSDWSSTEILVRLTWSDGSTTVLNDSSDYVTIDESLTESDTVRVENYPIGDTDPAAVSARLDVITTESKGSGDSGPVKNPTWNGDLPRLSAVKLSKWQPGTEDSFTVSVDPEDAARFGSFQRVEVTEPDGTTTTYSDVTNGEITAQTGGEGLHRVAVVFTAGDSENTEFTEVLRVEAGKTSRDRPPSIRGQSGSVGRYAVVGHGLETGEVTVNRGGSEVTMTAVIPQDGDVPQTLTADTRDLSVSSDATTTIQLQRGDTRSTVRERIGIVLYADELDDGALVWRNDDALTRSGTEWGGVTVENLTTIDTISDETASVEIRVNADPGPIDRIRHWANANLPSLPFGMIAIDLTPFVALLIARRRRDPPEPPQPDQPGEHRQPNPQEA